MNKPDKAGEPSIDEILASIRQKTAAESGASGEVSDTGASSPPADAWSAGPDPAPSRETPPALLDRLNGMGKSVPQGASSFGAKRPLPFDHDLADMFDEPDATSAGSSAPKPEMRVTPSLGGFAPKAPIAAGAADSSSAGETAPDAAQASPSMSPLSAEKPAASPVPPRAPAFGFPPLTKQGGFYPAQRTEPRLSPMPGHMNGSGARAEDAVAAGHATPQAAGPGSAQPFSDFGALVPGEPAAQGGRSGQSSFGAPPLASGEPLSIGTSAPVERVLPDLDPDRSATPQPSLGGARTQVSHDEGSSGYGPSLAADGVALGASEPRLKEPPAPAVSDAPSAALGAPSARDPSATQALDALAAGLAASGASGDLRPAALKPAADVLPAPAAPQTSPVSNGGEAVSQPSSRSLEEVVADMLRPMLQKWVAENMPRIMEKALRSEMQRTMTSGKPSSPKSGA